jgi:serine/threonine protein kinase
VDRGDGEASMLARGLESVDASDAASLAALLDDPGRGWGPATWADPSAATVPIESGEGGATRAGERPVGFESGPFEPPGGGRAGRYRILKPLARGGLGEVYIARDTEVERAVALKVMRLEAMRSEGLRERFVRESEINGNLEHPGIIPVYGQGEFEDGRPYYAMRLVEGGTLQQAIERHRREAEGGPREAWVVGLRPLLRRFLVVCEAIAYAHGRGVLHRDLKPSNVLLGPYGETLIIDWGLAKLIGHAEAAPAVDGAAADEAATASQLVLHTGSGTVPTQAGQTLGSPPFMSPEQAGAGEEPPGEASDVYGLGATLYTLLTGRPPVVGEAVQETLRRVREGRIDPVRQVEPRVPAALAAVCARAMRVKPADRYPTARALAEDLERWLADEPVSAHRDGWVTRLGRWGRRHRPAVAGGLGLLAAGLVGQGVSNVLIGHERDRADRARIRAEAEATRAARAEVDARAALRLALESQALAKEHLRDGMALVRELVALGDRQILARLRADERRGFLERSVEFARRFREREPEDHDLRLSAADVERRLGNLARLQGDLAEAARLLSEAAEDLSRLPEEPVPLEALALTRLDLGDALALGGRLGEAEAVFRGAAEAARRLAERVGEAPGALRTRARALDRLGSIAHLRGDAAGAAEAFREALAALEALAVEDAAGVRRAFDAEQIAPLYDDLERAGVRARLAEAAADTGEVEAGLRLLDEADARLTALEQEFGSGRSRDVEFHRAWVAVQRGRGRNDAGRPEGVSEAMEAALERLEALEQEDPGQPGVQRAIAEARLERARAALAAGEAARAEADARAALGLLEAARAPDLDLPVARAEAWRVAAEAALVVDAGRTAEARSDLERAAEALAEAGRAGVRPPRAGRLEAEVRGQLAALGG